MRILRRECPQLHQLRLRRDHLILQLRDHLQLDGSLLLGIDHALLVSVGGESQRGLTGNCFRFLQFLRRIPDDISPSALVQLVHQRFRLGQQAAIDLVRVLGCKRADLQRGDRRSGVISHFDLLLIIVEKPIARDARPPWIETVQHRNRVITVGASDQPVPVQSAQSVARQDIFLRRIAFIAHTRSARLDQSTQAGRVRLFGTTHDETGFRDVKVSTQAVI